MALHDSLGGFLPDFNLFELFSNFLNLVVIIIVLIVGVAVIYFGFRHRAKNKQGIMKEIHWWEEVGGEMVKIRIDKAIELSIPGTSLKLFYVKNKDLWLPRFTRGVSPTEFYVALTPNKEIINFSLLGISESLKSAGLDYDHTDMRWAAENLREFVKRNYRDKATTWWKEYAGVITTAIYILVMTFSFVIILFFLQKVIGDIGQVASSVGGYIDRLEACVPTSGVVSG